MKKLLFIIIVVLTGCQNDSNIEMNTFLEELNRRNLEYFEIQSPEFYHENPSYLRLNQVDSLSKLLVLDLKKGKENEVALKVFIETSKSIMNVYPKQAESLSEGLNRMNDIPKIMNTILEIEYICGNILIEEYNRNFFKMRAVKAVVQVNDRISLGDTLKARIFLAGIDPDNKFIAKIGEDTLPYINEYIPYFEFVPREKGSFAKKGKLVIESSLNRGFSTKEFVINYEVE